MAEMTDQEFVESVVKAIVDNPSGVSTKRSVDEMGVLIELTVAPEDMGKIIGKEGRTAKAVRTLLRVFGAKNNSRINLKIVEPEGSTERRRPDADKNAEESEPVMKKTEEKEAKSEDVEDVPTDVLA